MKITKRISPSPEGDITLFRIENASGASVEVSSLGAGITSVRVPDKFGEIAEVALGYENPADYMADGPCMGKVPGRYANRIAKGHLEVEGKTYQLNINNGPNALHGGPTGFQNRLWDAALIPNGVRFTYVSKDGEENYPGTLSVSAEYTWSEDNVLTLNLKATTDAVTVVNLTNHAYFNLEGADSGSVLKHKLCIKSNNYLPTDTTQIPTGELAPVKGTPMDFTSPKEIGIDINADFEPLKIGKGYDHCWAIDNWEKGKLVEGAVVLAAPSSGRILTISSTQPGVQIYTGNWLDGSPKNKSGVSYKDYEGVAIEMQGFPDAPNKPGFPSQELKPGETYNETIKFAFSVE
ncbi:MAG: galactose mutarotase [Muribaculaceae bacterium]|nr:galactose mutarotase [Muribaculaceae bacterium]